MLCSVLCSVVCSGKILAAIESLGFGTSWFFGGMWHSQCALRTCSVGKLFDLDFVMNFGLVLDEL